MNGQENSTHSHTVTFGARLLSRWVSVCLCAKCKYAWVRLPAHILHGQWMKAREGTRYANTCVSLHLCGCFHGRWTVSHHLWLIKRRQSKRLILTHCLMAKKTTDGHTCLHTHHTHTSSMSHSFAFLLPLPFSHYCVHIHISVCCTHTDTLARVHAENELRADSAICGFGSGSRRQDKRNQSVPAEYSMSPTSCSS